MLPSKVKMLTFIQFSRDAFTKTAMFLCWHIFVAIFFHRVLNNGIAVAAVAAVAADVDTKFVDIVYIRDKTNVTEPNCRTICVLCMHC